MNKFLSLHLFYLSFSYFLLYTYILSENNWLYGVAKGEFLKNLLRDRIYLKWKRTFFFLSFDYDILVTIKQFNLNIKRNLHTFIAIVILNIN